VMDRVSQTLLVDRLAILWKTHRIPATCGWHGHGRAPQRAPGSELLKICPARAANNTIFFESSAAFRMSPIPFAAQSNSWISTTSFLPHSRAHSRLPRLGKTVDGDFLSSDDVELVQTIAGYLAIALDNSQLYTSLEQKASKSRA